MSSMKRTIARNIGRHGWTMEGWKRFKRSAASFRAKIAEKKAARIERAKRGAKK